MTEKDTFIKWMNESGLSKVYDELDKKVESQLLEIQSKKPKKYKEIKQCEKTEPLQKKNSKHSV